MSTKIEWTQETWNPFVGCTLASAGCLNCYAMRLAPRIKHASYHDTTKKVHGKTVWSGRINRASPAQMEKPLRLKRPSRIFVNSMSDFFHPGAPDEWRLEALAIMHAAPQHQYQVLTKRPQHIVPFLTRTGVALPHNFWCGATVERQDTAHRIATLRAVPAHIRFLSIEPLLGALKALDLSGIQWLIAGGESGPGARPMSAAWIRALRDWCLAQGVAFFFKQWGTPSNNPLFEAHRPAALKQRDPHGKGGALLDGRLWRQYPQPV